ncbi:hypothetical protein KVT40_005322 [Elsinoe batatas]|uniref:Large ribosomal subunit protein mL44 n=1 Tax=Elsinoe batatas TaxID=2601811 RepID=A0A8K0KZN4_9PEZI|nr:hypothetical protein KVT40_005322 [Elsinoe batatas]
MAAASRPHINHTIKHHRSHFEATFRDLLMRRVRFGRWSGAYLPPRNPRTINANSTAPADATWSCHKTRIARASVPSSSYGFHTSICRRQEAQTQLPFEEPETEIEVKQPRRRHRELHSAKLGALHARLSLPARFTLLTLARCLTDPSADRQPEHNNASLALLGQELIAYYTAEWLICNYPRLPMPIIYAAQYAYSGDKTLAMLRQEWGVEAADAPGPEVDVGYLQFERVAAGNAMAGDRQHLVKDVLGAVKPQGTGRPREQFHDRRGISSRIVFDDEFGDLKSGVETHESALGLDQDVVQDLKDGVPAERVSSGITLEAASAQFIRAVFGALYLYSGATSMQSFHHAHILSRHLPLHKLFYFRDPTRDLKLLCQREQFEAPVARLISETGRKTRSPVYVVGVYSGRNKLGEDAGSSLNEGRVRAAAQALRSWYLYSPPADQICLPSRQAELERKGEKWKPQMVDSGEIVT